MITLAFAGAGTIAVIHGLAASATDTPVVAVAARTTADAEPLAEQLQARVVTIDELPSGADAIVVASPPELHAPHAIAALEAGASVLIETPLAATLAEADAIVDAADRAAERSAGGRTVYAENLAFSPVVRASLALIDDLGPLTSLEVRALSPRPTWGDLGSARWGGGCLFELGVHAVAVALFAAGVDIDRDAVISVSASAERPPDLEVDDHATVVLQLRSGSAARIEVSWQEESPVWDLQASSASGVVRTTLLPATSIERNGEPITLLPTPPTMNDHVFQLGYTEQLRELEMATEGAPTPIDARFGRQILELICAAHASVAIGGDPVAIPFTGPRDRTPFDLITG